MWSNRIEVFHHHQTYSSFLRITSPITQSFPLHSIFHFHVKLTTLEASPFAIFFPGKVVPCDGLKQDGRHVCLFCICLPFYNVLLLPIIALHINGTSVCATITNHDSCQPVCSSCSGGTIIMGSWRLRVAPVKRHESSYRHHEKHTTRTPPRAPRLHDVLIVTTTASVGMSWDSVAAKVRGFNALICRRATFSPRMKPCSRFV